MVLQIQKVFSNFALKSKFFMNLLNILEKQCQNCVNCRVCYGYNFVLGQLLFHKVPSSDSKTYWKVHTNINCFSFEIMWLDH